MFKTIQNSAVWRAVYKFCTLVCFVYKSDTDPRNVLEKKQLNVDFYYRGGGGGGDNI